MDPPAGSPSPARLLGEIKAARAEVIRLQHELRRFAREHARQYDAVRCLISQRSSDGSADPLRGGAGAAVAVAGGEGEGVGRDENRGVGGGNGGSGGVCSGTEARADSAMTSIPASASNLVPIGRLSSCFVRLNGTPRNAGGLCSHARAVLRLSCPEPAAAADGLAEFSHVWVLFGFHRNKKIAGAAKPKVAPPKLGGRRVGVLSTRAPYRPNPIGLSLARLDRVDDGTLYLSGLDAVDGTPVYDIKP